MESTHSGHLCVLAQAPQYEQSSALCCLGPSLEEVGTALPAGSPAPPKGPSQPGAEGFLKVNRSGRQAAGDSPGPPPPPLPSGLQADLCVPCLLPKERAEIIELRDWPRS